jgi:hypothetical protein
MLERRIGVSSIQLVICEMLRPLECGATICSDCQIKPESNTTNQTYHSVKYTEHKFLEQVAMDATAKSFGTTAP